MTLWYEKGQSNRSRKDRKVSGFKGRGGETERMSKMFETKTAKAGDQTAVEQ